MSSYAKKPFVQIIALLSVNLLSIGVCTSLAAESTYPETTSEHYLDLSLGQLMGLEISSATKRPETIADIPATVTIITRRDLERMGYPNLEEVLRNVPGLYLHDDFFDTRIGVRAGIDGGIQFLVNGVPRHPTRIKGLTLPDRSRLNIPLQSIDRIEVVRGPMSVIYGNNAFLGSVNVVTNQAESAPNLASASYGNNGARQLFLRLREERDEGFVVFNAGFDTGDGVEGRYAELMGPDQQAALDPQMHTDLGGDMDHENFNADLSANYRDITLNLQYSRMDYGFYFDTPPFEEGSRVELDSFHASLGYDRPIADSLRLASHLIYSRETQRVSYDYLSPDLEGSNDQDSNLLEFQAELDWSPTDRFNLMGGFRHHHASDISLDFDVPVVVVLSDQASDEIRNELFMQADYRPIDALKLVAGTRWSHRKAIHIDRSVPEFDLNLRYDFPSRTDRVPRLGAIWTIDDHHLLKLLYGEALQDNHVFSSETFIEPEKISTWELNYLSHFDRGSVSLSLFNNRIDGLPRDVRVPLPSGGFRSRIESIGQFESRGVELITRFKLLHGLDWSFSATWQETKNLEQGAPEPGNSPDWLAKSQLSYREGSWSSGLSLNYVDDMEAESILDTETNTWSPRGNTVAGYLLLDTNLRYDFPGRGAYANLHLGNLLDEEVRYPANHAVDFLQGIPGPGRSALLTLGWKF